MKKNDNTKLLMIIRKFDKELKGVLELEYKHRNCTEKEFISKLIYQDMPIWIEDNKDDIDFINCISELATSFKTYLN